MFNVEIDLALYTISTFICILILKLFFLCFFQVKNGVLHIPVYLIYMIWQLFLFIKSPFSPYVNLVVGLMLNCLVAVVCFEGNILQKIALSGVLSILWTLSEFLVGSFFMGLKIDIVVYKAWGALLSELLTLVILFCLYKFFQIENIKTLPAKYYTLLLVLPIGSLFIIYKMFMYSYMLNQRILVGETALCLIIMLFINLMIFRLYVLLANEFVMRKNNAIFTQQTELYSKVIKEKELSMAEEHLARHDMKHHYTSLLGMMQNHEYDRAEAYLNKLTDGDPNRKDISRTGNHVVDAMINAKHSAMKALDIEFISDIHIPMELPFDAADMSVLFGNVLDNAIDANSSDILEKYIKFYMVFDKNILIITEINSYDGILLRDRNGKILTRKEEKESHGFGLISIGRIAEKYHGSMVIEETPEEFKIKIMLMDCGAMIFSSQRE